MKQLVLLVGSVFCLATATMAQTSNAILFTENGEKFQVILNGILQNNAPETNVKITGLNAPNYKARIIFSDTKLGYLDFNMIFPEPGEEVTWNIKRNNKGEFVTRWVSNVPIAQAPPPAPAQTVIVYTTTPAVPVPVTGTTTTTVQHSQTTTTTGTGMPMDDENVNINMGINMGAEGGNISINASGMKMGMDVQETSVSTTTTTTTTTHSTTSTGTVVAPAPVTAQVPAPVVYVSGYNGAIGCPVPMNPTDFSSFKETVSSKDFEQTKLTIAKQVLQNNCLTSAQVREVMGLFDFEATRLDFAKYAYSRTYDIGNYYKVNDAFEFESSVDDLNKYISR